jgi:hypothetical protein
MQIAFPAISMQNESPKHGLLAHANPVVSNILQLLPVTPFIYLKINVKLFKK